MTKHLASFGLIGVTGRRVGTRYVFKLEDIQAAISKPFFRFRNHECEADYLDWLMHHGHEEKRP